MLKIMERRYTVLIDSHAHYDDERFDADRDEILQKCIDSGVTHIVNAGASIESSIKSIELSRKFPFVYAAVGVHPEDALSCNERTIDQLTNLTKEPKVVAIGEIGLDYHYDDAAPREVQREWFAKQIALAVQLKLPIIIHDREAHRDVLDIIKAEKGFETGGVFHCYSGSKEMAREVLNLGFKIGIGGALTFKKAVRPLEVVSFVPLDMLLVETDCPYMTPEPYRGQRNWSGLIEIVLNKIAEIKEIEYNVAEEATSNNAIKLFRL